MRTEPRIVVLGVGNLIMGDEGVGVRCAQALEAGGRLPGFVRIVDGGTSTHELLEELEHLDALVIVDAVVTEGPPGHLVELEDDAVPTAFSNTMSPHQHGIHDLLATLTFLGRAPRRVVLIGMQPERVALGLELSPPVEAALPRLCDRVVEVVDRLC